MAMDIVDMLVNSSDEYLTGYYYSRRPKTPEDGKVTFSYKQLDPSSHVFDTVLGNVRSDRSTYAIKTNDDCGFQVGGYIVTQNGLCWTITEVVTNENAEHENAVLRWFREAKNAACSVRMLQVDSLFAVENAYRTDCLVTVNLCQDKKYEALGGDARYGACHFSVTVDGKELSQNEINIEIGDMIQGYVPIKVHFSVPKGKTGILTITLTLSDSTTKDYFVYARSYQTNQESLELNFAFD